MQHYTGMMGPKKHQSRAIVQTAIQPGRNVDSPMEGIDTEKDRQLQELVKRQLDTKITLESQLAKRKKFTSGSSFKPLSEEVAGSQDHFSYTKIVEQEARVEELRLLGLNQDEITYMLAHEGFSPNTSSDRKKRKFELKKPFKLADINEKIEVGKQRLSKPDNFAGAKAMTRHEMDLERAISHNKDKAQMLGCLITEISKSPLSDDPANPINHLDSILQEALASRRASVTSYKKEETVSPVRPPQHIEDQTQNESKITGTDQMDILEPSSLQGCAPKPKIPDTVAVVPECEIIKNKLTIAQIKELPKFQNYKQGEPSRVLYLKNLSARVSEVDLISLFIRFEKKDFKILFRLMNGRMRGQAFVTFDSAATAQRAMDLVNGFNLRGKPVIIEYGKK